MECLGTERVSLVLPSLHTLGAIMEVPGTVYYEHPSLCLDLHAVLVKKVHAGEKEKPHTHSVDSAPFPAPSALRRSPDSRKHLFIWSSQCHLVLCREVPAAL